MMKSKIGSLSVKSRWKLWCVGIFIFSYMAYDVVKTSESPAATTAGVLAGILLGSGLTVGLLHKSVMQQPLEKQ